MGVDPLTALLPVLGECRMVVTDARGRVIGVDAAFRRGAGRAVADVAAQASA
jgi:hypothetical protein